MLVPILQDTGKETPEIVSQQEVARGTLTNDGFLSAEASKAPLVLKLIKIVFTVSTVPIEGDDLGTIDFLRGIVRHVGVNDFFPLIPKLSLKAGVGGLEGAGDYNSAFGRSSR